MRRAAALVMVVLTALLLAGAAIAWYADTTLVDDQEFATRVTSSLDDDAVRGVVADQIVTGLTSSAVPNALVVRPLLVPLVGAVADTPVFRRVVHRALASRHRALVRGDTTFSLRPAARRGNALRGDPPRRSHGRPPHPRGPLRARAAAGPEGVRAHGGPRARDPRRLALAARRSGDRRRARRRAAGRRSARRARPRRASPSPAAACSSPRSSRGSASSSPHMPHTRRTSTRTRSATPSAPSGAPCSATCAPPRSSQHWVERCWRRSHRSRCRPSTLERDGAGCAPPRSRHHGPRGRCARRC